ncbi:hypothetical protein K435DRAFT_593738, partial [Dendrothele bispora CBS 962.96]
QVDILDKSAFEKKSQAGAIQSLIDTHVNKYTLNEEQKRAFCIVANHSVSPFNEQLNMYLGDFFTMRGESCRMIVVAPTGAAAACRKFKYGAVSGCNTAPAQYTTIPSVCSRLDGVDYVFLDEVSMLSCIDLYKISEKL